MHLLILSDGKSLRKHNRTISQILSWEEIKRDNLLFVNFDE